MTAKNVELMTKNINGESNRIYWVRVNVPVSKEMDEERKTERGETKTERRRNLVA